MKIKKKIKIKVQDIKPITKDNRASCKRIKAEKCQASLRKAVRGLTPLRILLKKAVRGLTPLRKS